MQRWQNHGVEGTIAWPRNEVIFKFGQYDIVAKPPSQSTQSSLHIDLHQSRLDGVGAMSLFNEILSLASWIDDQYSILLAGWSGNPKPGTVSRQAPVCHPGIVDGWPYRTTPLTDANARRAVAIYRQGLNAERYHAIPYAILSYYRILEINHKDGRMRAQWLENALAKLQTSSHLSGHLIWKEISPDPKVVAKFVYEQGRNAASHANFSSDENPDNIGEIRRLSHALLPMREVGRMYIQDELGVSDGRWE